MSNPPKEKPIPMPPIFKADVAAMDLIEKLESDIEEMVCQTGNICVRDTDCIVDQGVNPVIFNNTNMRRLAELLLELIDAREVLDTIEDEQTRLTEEVMDEEDAWNAVMSGIEEDGDIVFQSVYKQSKLFSLVDNDRCISFAVTFFASVNDEHDGAR